MELSLPIQEARSDLSDSLRENVRLLGDLLGEAIQKDCGQAFFEMIESIRLLAKEERIHPQLESHRGNRLIETLQQLPKKDLLPVARAFNQFLNFANIAEQHHRARFPQMDDYQPGKSPKTLPILFEALQSQGVSPENIYAVINQMRIELVLTAHPTEVVRRTLIHKYDLIDDCLTQLESHNHTNEELLLIRQRLKELVYQVWQTPEIRQQRPTPQDEAKWGYAVIEHSLWQALPQFYQLLDQHLLEIGQPRLPLTATPIRFASWIGGDRDGNPRVTAKVSLEVLLRARLMALEFYHHDVLNLRDELSMNRAPDWFMEVATTSDEPYRAVIEQLIYQLKQDQQKLEKHFHEKTLDQFKSSGNHPSLMQVEDFILPLKRCYEALCESNMELIANGALLNTLRRLMCFGLHLLKLDIRQEASRHRDVIAAILSQRHEHNYLSLTESERQTRLLQWLSDNEEVKVNLNEMTEEVREVIETFQLIHSQFASGLGSYVISMTKFPSDVLSVAVLMQTFSQVNLPISPLFETLDDLEAAPEIVAKLLAMPVYRARIQNTQEVMIGYSDSAKDAGQLSASWAQYQAQEALAEVCRAQQVHLVLFHGRGGTVGRGGGPVYAAILSQPPGSVNGSLRVTEQGEMIRFKFGDTAIAIRNLDIYLGATLEATLLPPAKPKAQWRVEMNRLSKLAYEAYKKTVQTDPRFVPYFYSFTPEAALARLPLGSRPAKRRQEGNLETLRAIPWIFAWTQTRLMLPVWLGSDVAFSHRLNDPEGQAVILEMREKWPFFSTYIDLLEMLLAKTDINIAAYYETQLIEEASLKSLGQSLRARLTQLNEILLKLIDQDSLLAQAPLIKQAIVVRNPYLDPLHGLQAELLKRVRHNHPLTDESLENALMVTMAGIAAGLRNTG